MDAPALRETIVAFLFALLAILMAVLAWVACAEHKDNEHLRKEAVKMGYAEWVNFGGARTWRWKEPMSR